MMKNQKLFVSIAAVLSLIAGILHATLIAFEHVAPLPLETLFFFGGGIVQIFLSILYIKTHRLKYALPLFVVNGSIAFLWVVTRLFRAPFMDTPEEVGALGLLVFVFELTAIILLAIWKWSHRHRIRKVHGYEFMHIILGLLVVSFFAGAAVYGGGLVGEKILPERTLIHGHGGDDDHSDVEPHVDEVPHDDEGEDDHVDIVPHDDGEKRKGTITEDDSDHVDEVPHD